MDPIYSFIADDIIIEVRYLTYDVIEEWHNNTQPLIDKIKPKRPDNGWDWWEWSSLARAYNTIGQKLKGYYISINDIPIALAYFAFQYNCVKDENKIPNFLWLMSSSPILDDIIEVTAEVTMNKPKLPIGDFFFEIIMEESKMYNSSDMFWLHASSDGDNPEELLGYYMYKNFLHCPLNRITLRSADDGRYLYRPETNREYIETVKAVY